MAALEKICHAETIMSKISKTEQTRPSFIPPEKGNKKIPKEVIMTSDKTNEAGEKALKQSSHAFQSMKRSLSKEHSVEYPSKIQEGKTQSA